MTVAEEEGCDKARICKTGRNVQYTVFSRDGMQGMMQMQEFVYLQVNVLIRGSPPTLSQAKSSTVASVDKQT